MGGIHGGEHDECNELGVERRGEKDEPGFLENVIELYCILLHTFCFILQEGAFVKLQLGQETTLYVDNDIPTHCFCPCGHMASEKTIKYVLCVNILFYLYIYCI